MRVALYCRCSTLDQTVNLQLDGLRDYARARGLEVVDEYIDEGVSGAKATRPALDRLQADARRRRFDAVAVWRLDRLARSVRHLTQLGADFEALGVDLIVLDQAIDTSTSAGRFLFHTLAAVGELERDLLRERTRAGLEAAKRRGRKLGRPRALSESQFLRLKRMAATGQSTRHIAQVLGIGKSIVGREIQALQAECPENPLAARPAPGAEAPGSTRPSGVL
jgi:DNA invertase Pin-like site-specific DNA recombinase